MAASPKVSPLPEPDAIQEIVDTVLSADPGEAPFALVLGAGFSHGIVPTARDIVEVSLPLWIHSRQGDAYRKLLDRTALGKRDIARAFWSGFVKRNESRGLSLTLSPDTGLPLDSGAAYRAAFEPLYSGALGAPKTALKFQREVMRLDQPRLNAAHFLLASILGVQPQGSRQSDNFNARAAFSRLILTTNFDPFLQVALQSVNRLYFMSDTPEFGIAEELLSDQAEAIHLVYVHGSIHRPLQAATDDDIQALKKKNAHALAGVLKERGVIVIGYSGWDDAIVEALAACDRFGHRLFWCGREPDPLTAGAFGPRVAEILKKPTARYVRIDSAGRFMAQLSAHLIKGLPRLLHNPIAQVRELVECIDMAEFESLAPERPAAPDAPPSGGEAQNPVAGRRTPAEATAAAGSGPEVLAGVKISILQRLVIAEQVFSGTLQVIRPTPSVPVAASQPEAAEPAGKQVAQNALSSARAAMALADYELALESFNKALDSGELSIEERVRALVDRGVVFQRSRKLAQAIQDYSEVIDSKTAPVAQIALALRNRATAWVQQKQPEKAIDDYSRVIDGLPGVPVEHVALALFSRGYRWGLQEDSEKEIADYTRLIDLSDAPATQVARALLNRGLEWNRQGQAEKAIADYSRLIDEVAGAPTEVIGEALLARGFAWNKKGDREKELADYDRLLTQCPDASAATISQVLLNRGVTFDNMGELDKAVADYSRIIESVSGAPVEKVAWALLDRGIVVEKQGKYEQAIADYSRIIDNLPGASTEQIARALLYRGIAWGKLNNSERKFADYNRVIELPDAPVAQLTRALGGRGWAYYLQRSFPQFLADTEAALAKTPNLDYAMFNLGLALLANNRDSDAAEAYARAAEAYPQAIDKLALADLDAAERDWLSAARSASIREILRRAATQSPAA